MTGYSFAVGLGLWALACFWIFLRQSTAQVAPWAPWLVLALGAALLVAGMRRARDAVAATAVVLAAQVPALWLHDWLVVGEHRAPAALGVPVLALARLLGLPVQLGDGAVHLVLLREPHAFAITWEGIGLEPALLIVLGALALARCAGHGVGALVRRFVALALITGAWVVARFAAVLVMDQTYSLYLAYDSEASFVRVLWNPWFIALSFAPLGALAGPMVAPAHAAAPAALATPTRALRDWIVTAAGTALVALGLALPPGAERKPGRVLIDQEHSRWERIDRRFDTGWYGQESGYNYSCVTDYLGRFFDVDSTRGPLTPGRLATCDVLVLKIPTRPFAAAEVDAVVEYVRGGGGLFLIGDHTNVFGSSLYLNALARPLGFEYRYDCLFDVRRVFQVWHRPPWPFPHAIVRGLPELLFMTPCSIRPVAAGVEHVMVRPRLKSLPIDYASPNFYPPVRDRTDMTFGRFALMVARRVGRGRVAGFTDSTIFSNFAAFFPGRAELFVRTVEWLNWRNRPGWPRGVLVLVGAAVLAAAAVRGRILRVTGVPLAALVAAVAAGALTGAAAGSYLSAREGAMPAPRRPLAQVAFDVSHGDDPFVIDAERPQNEKLFRIFFQWVPRLGAFPRVRDGIAAAVRDSGTAVLLNPNRPFGADDLARLERHVRDGGRLLVVDGPRNRATTANQVLQRFGLSYSSPRGVEFRELLGPARDTLVVTGPFGGWAVAGGRPFLMGGGHVLGAGTRFGRGQVAALGLGVVLADRFMGGEWSVVPNAALRGLYGVEFEVLGALLEGRDPYAAGARRGVAATPRGR